MRFTPQKSNGRQPMRRRRRLAQAALVGVVVAAVLSLLQWTGLFASMRLASADYLYETTGDPGDDIVIVAIDERSQQALGEWPWPFAPYVRLFERLQGAGVIGFDVLLPDPGPEGNLDTPALIEATRQAANVILPLMALDVDAPTAPGGSYWAGRTVQPFPALLKAAAGAGSVEAVLDRDGTLRRVPLLLETGGNEAREAFGLQVLRVRLGLGDAPAALTDGRLVIGDETEVKYEVRTDESGAMLVNFVGQPNTFPTYSFVDVIEDRVDAGAFEGKIVLVGMMDVAAEVDLHRTPVSARRMSGVEFQANVIHTLLYHRPLVPQSRVGATVTVALLALVSAVALSQLGVLPGAALTVLLTVGYFVFTSIQFDAGRLPDVLFPYLVIFINYGVVMATRFAREQVERRRVSEVFGRFVSAEVRDAIVSVALEDPDLVQPGGRQMDVSVLFADIRGFTAIAESLPPSEVVEVLNQYLDSMEEEVFKQRGTLDKYTGDGMMVLFGAPLEQPDHAERAVRAALGMQRAAAAVIRQRGDAQWKMGYGIAIATGPAVVGHIGSKRRLDYTAIGDTVNLAARLEGVAPPATILVNRACYEAIKDIALVEELEPVMVKGKSKPVVAYRILGLREDVA